MNGVHKLIWKQITLLWLKESLQRRYIASLHLNFQQGTQRIQQKNHAIIYKLLQAIEKGTTFIKDCDRGSIPLISSTSLNNGTVKFVNKINSKQFSKNLITVSSNGSIGESFYQANPFYATGDVNVLIPKFLLNPYVAMFLNTVIELEKYRFIFGRKQSKTKMLNPKIKLPIIKANYPD